MLISSGCSKRRYLLLFPESIRGTLQRGCRFPVNLAWRTHRPSWSLPADTRRRCSDRPAARRHCPDTSPYRRWRSRRRSCCWWRFRWANSCRCTVICWGWEPIPGWVRRYIGRHLSQIIDLSNLFSYLSIYLVNHLCMNFISWGISIVLSFAQVRHQCEQCFRIICVKECRPFQQWVKDSSSLSVTSRAVSGNWFHILGPDSLKLQEPYRERVILKQIRWLHSEAQTLHVRVFYCSFFFVNPFVDLRDSLSCILINPKQQQQKMHRHK